MNTHWSSPKMTYLEGLKDLRSALASGYNAELIRIKNEDAKHPLTKKVSVKKIKNIKPEDIDTGGICTISSKKEIDESNRTDVQKYIALNFIRCFGEPEAIKAYQEKGELSTKLSKGIGTAHMMRVQDLIQLYKESGDNRHGSLTDSYIKGIDTAFFNFNGLKHSGSTIVKTDKKLWCVNLLDNDQPKAKTPFGVKVLNVLYSLLKWIPKKSVLQMDEYKNVSYRVGDVTHGFSVEFHVPKKFSFN